MEDNENQVQEQRAWVLNFGGGFLGALAYHEMSQVLLEEPIYPVPCTPAYCNEVILSKNRILPLMNLAKLLRPRIVLQKQADIVGVAVYQREPYEPLQYVGLHLVNTPQSIVVNDKQFCELPEEPALWAKFSFSCFMYGKQKIPIINLAHLFSAEFLAEVNPHES